MKVAQIKKAAAAILLIKIAAEKTKAKKSDKSSKSDDPGDIYTPGKGTLIGAGSGAAIGGLLAAALSAEKVRKRNLILGLLSGGAVGAGLGYGIDTRFLGSLDSATAKYKRKRAKEVDKRDALSMARKDKFDDIQDNIVTAKHFAEAGMNTAKDVYKSKPGQFVVNTGKRVGNTVHDGATWLWDKITNSPKDDDVLIPSSPEVLPPAVRPKEQHSILATSPTLAPTPEEGYTLITNNSARY